MDLDPASWGGLELGLKIGPVKTSTVSKFCEKGDSSECMEYEGYPKSNPLSPVSGSKMHGQKMYNIQNFSTLSNYEYFST